jgi:AcrR family transcriptional regulator
VTAPDNLVKTAAGYNRPESSRARAALRGSAERLFAEHGVDGVSLRQITREAGQRNTTAVAYHFGSRDGLLRAVLDHHLGQVALRREALLGRYRDSHPGPTADPAASPTADPAALLELADVLVRPLCAELDCPDGGPEFLRVAADVVSRSDWLFEPGSPIAVLISSAATGWAELTRAWMPPDAADRLHRRFAVTRFVHVELGRRARQVVTRGDNRLFASQLSDLVVALLTAPLSARTQALLAERTQSE